MSLRENIFFAFAKESIVPSLAIAMTEDCRRSTSREEHTERERRERGRVELKVEIETKLDIDNNKENGQ